MDQKVLVKEFEKTAAQVEKLYGPVALMLLVAPDEESLDSWNVIVSAQGLDRKAYGESVRLFTETVRKTLPRPLWSAVARVTVLRTSDPFVQAFVQRYAALHSGSTLQAVSVSGIDLPKAVIVGANRKAA